MKKLFLLLYPLLFISCISQNKLLKIENKKPERIRILKINNSVEKFEISDLPDEIGANKKNKNEVIYITKTDNSYSARDKDGKTLLYYSKSAQIGSAFSGYDYSENPLIGLYKEFYPNNSIKTKGVYCWFGFKIGKWYNYDENGDLVSTEDFDNGFKYNVNQVFSYCQKNGISLEKKESGYKTTISKYKSNTDNKNYWIIRYPNYDKQVYINFEMDGINGNVVKKVESPFPED
ncbi:hypothetical protein EYY60_02980 [Flavobacterium zhairuonense]|uniref:hypothetical protein n=1 Tax=Flavobacterium zhairuonense TaxID=2493631 RepID=UPI00104D92E9|nr:hypothetical protein [Flavobacterium zhairuonense]KAF2515036.1 hypothetical protein EYY60_02980 [Flavobacterium zhairuonense]